MLVSLPRPPSHFSKSKFDPRVPLQGGEHHGEYQDTMSPGRGSWLSPSEGAPSLMPTDVSMRPRWIAADMSTTNQWLPEEPSDLAGCDVLGGVAGGIASKTSMPEQLVSSDVASQGSRGSRGKSRPGRGGSRSPPVVRVHSPDHVKVRVSRQMKRGTIHPWKDGQLGVRNNDILGFEFW